MKSPCQLHESCGINKLRRWSRFIDKTDHIFCAVSMTLCIQIAMQKCCSSSYISNAHSNQVIATQVCINAEDENKLWSIDMDQQRVFIG